MSVAGRLRQENAALFEAALAHPFVTGIGDGGLPRHVFGRWIAQDWLYLQGYVEALERAATLADAEDASDFWQELARSTREVELDLHRGLAARFGLTIDDLDATAPYGATTAYLAVLREAGRTYPTLVATLTPCAVGYAEIARALASRGPSPEPDYAAWVETYTDAAFQQSVGVFTEELDRCASALSDLTAIEQAYARAARCELEFWDGLWRGL